MKVTVNENEAFSLGELAADVFSREIPEQSADDSLNALSGFALEHIGKRGQADTLDKFVAEILGQSGQADESADNMSEDVSRTTKSDCKSFAKRVKAAIEQHNDEFEKGVKAEAKDILERTGWLPD